MHATHPKMQSLRRPMTSNDDDLDWLFGCADAAMGMRSTFGAMIDALKVGYQDTRAGDDGLVSAAHEQLHHEATAIGCGRGAVQLSRSAATRRYGRVVKVFATLAPLHKRVLEAWFYPRQWPPQVTAYFGRAAGVVALCESAAGLDVTARGLGAIACADSARSQRIREEANTLYQAACLAYEAAKVGARS